MLAFEREFPSLNWGTPALASPTHANVTISSAAEAPARSEQGVCPACVCACRVGRKEDI